ncbi:hypothetical protein NEUTE2DRAFT_129846 [Neurospora tetrasperma FGSC 2509]|nr:hypothetical protein NEUTE2DRAFT_129846 [Neurospora tetrasperma FGSC 2509]
MKRFLVCSYSKKKKTPGPFTSVITHQKSSKDRTFENQARTPTELQSNPIQLQRSTAVTGRPEMSPGLPASGEPSVR